MQNVNLASSEEKLVFDLSGEIDAATSDDFYNEVKYAYEHDRKDVVFRCGRLTFIDSTTLGTFVKIFKNLKADGYRMTIQGLRPNVKKLFDICGLTDVMEIRDDE
ncbi:MAG: STAS domain-containing protein [Clostridia bacterium]|nr:STAS domain-containing protein [Clostridia bacterium]